MKAEQKISEVTKIFAKLGASEKQAKTMASQLCKRAEQVAKKENLSEFDVSKELLEIAILGAQGMTKSKENPQFEEKKGETAKKSHFCEKV